MVISPGILTSTADLKAGLAEATSPTVVGRTAPTAAMSSETVQPSSDFSTISSTSTFDVRQRATSKEHNVNFSSDMSNSDVRYDTPHDDL